jgi:hypothetical protein
MAINPRVQSKDPQVINSGHRALTQVTMSLSFPALGEGKHLLEEADKHKTLSVDELITVDKVRFFVAFNLLFLQPS